MNKDETGKAVMGLLTILALFWAAECTEQGDVSRKAARTSDTRQLQRLPDTGFDGIARGSDCLTDLTRAVVWGTVADVKMLLDKGVDVNIRLLPLEGCESAVASFNRILGEYWSLSEFLRPLTCSEYYNSFTSRGPSLCLSTIWCT